MNLSDFHPSLARKVFLGGRPKAAGKTTFAMTAPGRKLVLQYDLGNPLVPPGVDASQCWARSYAPASPDVQLKTDRWAHATNVGEAVLRDAMAVREAFLAATTVPFDIKHPSSTREAFLAAAPIRFPDGEEVPLPDVLILDGMTELPSIMIDWILGVNKKFEADDFLGEGGRPNYFKLWQKRLEVMRSLLHMLIPLPCSVVLIGWEAEEMVANARTGKMLPDIGGKLDNLIPGKVDAALRCYAKSDGFFVQMKPDGVREWIGIRGDFDGRKEVDVTIHPGKKEPSPWERVFGLGKEKL